MLSWATDLILLPLHMKPRQLLSRVTTGDARETMERHRDAVNILNSAVFIQVWWELEYQASM